VASYPHGLGVNPPRPVAATGSVVA
jgi:hypothetical protein